MLSALCVGLAGCINPMLAQGLSFLLVPFTAYFLQILSWTAALPGAYIDGFKINPIFIMGIYLVLTSLIIKIRDNKKYSKAGDLK
jgi:hypothetical protein